MISRIDRVRLNAVGVFFPQITMGRRELQDLPHLTADVARLVNDLEKETDRGAALLAAAFLDDVLDVMLRAAFVDDGEAVNKIMGAGRPLESFGARAHLAYCIGILGVDVYADINLIREIRNDFAHRHPTNFEYPPIQAKCQKLRCVSVMLTDEACTPRERFVVDVVLIANHLIIETGQTKHAQPVNAFAQNGVLRLK